MSSLVRFMIIAATALGTGSATAQTFQSAPPSALGYSASSVSANDASLLGEALRAVRSGDLERASSLRDQISDPVAQRIVRWAAVDAQPSSLAPLELETARRDFWGWPRGDARQASAERGLERASYPADRVIAWFDGAPPTTAEGALALASALQSTGKTAEAQALIRSWWRDRSFELDVQERMLSRHAAWLTEDDHAERLDTLLLGPQGPATQAMMNLVSADRRALAEARIALRNESDDATAKFNRVPGALASDPGLAVERARYLRRRGLETLGYGLVSRFPAAPAHAEGQDLLWTERRMYMLSALKARDWRTAYAAMNNHGFERGVRRAEAEFFAGWVALRKLNDPVLAAKHFAQVAEAGSTPITQGRALYWQGRAAEARGDAAAAKAHYLAGSKNYTTFYGQLSAEKAGLNTLTLGKDPVPTDADGQRFEGRELVKAARILKQAGENDLFRAFVMHIDDSLPNAEEAALLHDLAKSYGEQDLAMKVVRTAAQRGFVLPERGYPIVQPPAVSGAAEPAYVLSISRQESNFFPGARSHANARGMMQLLPATGRGVARKLGIEWRESGLYEPEYNMRLGSVFLQDMIDRFRGSYPMAAAAYNAGPGRPETWAADCGDPRGGGTDPVDFIECIPFSETRDYVMRTMETLQIYRARLAGGSAPLNLSADLRRGGYTPPPPT